VYCGDCGIELSDNVHFCTKCGKPVHGSSVTSQGRLETREFSEPIAGRTRFRTASSFEHDYFSNLAQAMRGPIDAAVKSLLERLTPLGWEPMEPIDAGRLVLASRVVMEDVHDLGHPLIPFSDKYWKELVEVRIRFRRWVTDDQLKREKRIESRQDYDRETLDMLMKMNKTRDFNKRREIIKSNIGRVLEPSFLPSFYLQMDLLREQGEQVAKVAENMNAALVLEIQDLVKKGDISRLAPGAVVANLVIVDDPSLYHLDSSTEAYVDALAQVIGSNFVQLYPRVSHIRSDIRNHFATMTSEAEARAQYINGETMRTRLVKHADSWRETAQQVEIMADLMDAVQSSPPDAKAIASLSRHDADHLVAWSIPLVKAFELLGDHERKERVNRALAEAFLRL
jgi:hypothetical protein